MQFSIYHPHTMTFRCQPRCVARPVSARVRNARYDVCCGPNITCDFQCLDRTLAASGLAGRFKWDWGLARMAGSGEATTAVTLQQDPEHETVRDKEQRYHDGRNEVSGTQLTRLDPDTDKTLIKCVE